MNMKCPECGYLINEKEESWSYGGQDWYLITTNRLQKGVIDQIMQHAQTFLDKSIETIYIDTSYIDIVTCETCILHNIRFQHDDTNYEKPKLVYFF